MYTDKRDNIMTIDQAMGMRCETMGRYITLGTSLKFPYNKNDIQCIHDAIEEVVKAFNDTSNILEFDDNTSEFINELKSLLVKFKNDMIDPVFTE